MLLLEQDSCQPVTQLEALTDTKTDLTLEKILSDPARYPFHRLNTASPNFGYRNTTVWLHLSLRNLGNNNWLLHIPQSRVDHAELFSVVNGKIVEHQISGDQIPFSKRPLPHEQLLFRLSLDKDIAKDIYLKLQSRDSLMLPVKIWRADKFWVTDSDRRLLQGIYYGTLITMMLLSFLVWVHISGLTYLIFSLFLAAFTLVLMSLDGLAARLLWGEWVWWGKISLPLFEGISVIFAMIFTDRFLQLQLYLPIWRKALLALTLPAILVVVLALFGQYQLSIKVMTWLGLFSGLIVLCCGILGLRKRLPAAPLFLLAWLIFLIGVVTFAMTVLGVLPATLLSWQIMQLGAALLAVLLSLALTTQFNLMTEAISRFVPHQFLNILNKESLSDVQLGDAVLKKITVLFTDIRNFTTLSEQMTPEENFEFLNNFLAFIEPAVGEYGGFVDKFIGDAIMALFPKNVDQAVSAAISMQNRLHGFNAKRADSGYPPIAIGIGIHCGEMMLGTVGSNDRLDTTVIGDAVNLAARIEEMTKTYHATILISGLALQQMEFPERYCIREIDCLQLRGTQKPINIYEIFDTDPEPLRLKKLQTRPDLKIAVEKITLHQPAEAKVILEDILKIFPEDTVTQLLLNRCQGKSEYRKRRITDKL
jgi:adenylate cyclase